MGLNVIPYNCGGTISIPLNDLAQAACYIATQIQNDPAYSGMGISYAMIGQIFQAYVANIGKGGAPFTPDNNAAASVTPIAQSLGYTVDQVYAVMWETYSAAHGNPPSQYAQEVLAASSAVQPGGLDAAWQGIQNALKSLGTIGTILPWALAAGAIMYVASWLPKKHN